MAVISLEAMVALEEQTGKIVSSTRQKTKRDIKISNLPKLYNPNQN